MPFKLPPLPYAANSLDKAIDAETMTIHHDKHHQAYVDNANKALSGQKARMLDLLQNASKQPAAVRNNVGGHWNHSFFWTVLSGNEKDNALPARLEKDIVTKWGSVAKFQEEFEKAGAAQFGSGWAWLIRTPEGLKITSTPNQDNPLMDVVADRGWPILGADVWEHAYYLRYQNKRPEYLKKFWTVVNWKMVDQYDQEALKNKLP
ncbi:MAG: superoxide dismutase [Bdellovibrionaceae bacterium]|nr:superoxide dismutase [Pseudobdellovibrionaceae bacterium]MBX3033519.1 superoxide dismutase [Pseudobdellovibrionaceae bacterium]